MQSVHGRRYREKRLLVCEVLVSCQSGYGLRNSHSGTFAKQKAVRAPDAGMTSTVASRLACSGGNSKARAKQTRGRHCAGGSAAVGAGPMAIIGPGQRTSQTHELLCAVLAEEPLAAAEHDEDTDTNDGHA